MELWGVGVWGMGWIWSRWSVIVGNRLYKKNTKTKNSDVAMAILIKMTPICAWAVQSVCMCTYIWYMHVYLALNVSVCFHVNSPMHVHVEDRGRCQHDFISHCPPYFLKQLLYWVWSLPFQLGLLASKFLGSIWLFLSGSGVTTLFHLA